MALLDLREDEKSEILRSLWFPLLFVSLIWLVKIIEIFSGFDFEFLGIFPRELNGLRGIVFFPLIHANWQHLINNTIPLFVLTWALCYAYRPIAFKVFFLLYFVHGFWLWIIGREAYHIGASGIIYGLGTFLFVSGIIRKNSNLLAVSLLVAFLYGSMVWGIFPYEEYISWEGHLTGLVAGLVLAFYYKNYGPPPNIRQWANAGENENYEDETDAEDETEEEEAYWNDPKWKEKEDI
jgi:membrane associated rhomboid family serine protease